MAVAPGPSDARVPCPLCGGSIHPIAGRCKHCKADLTTFHASRPAANTPLPALLRGERAAASPQANGHAHAHAHAHATITHVAPIAIAREASQPVLPPRPTGRVAAPDAPSSGWRSWPVLVIILAAVAIVAAAVLMVWPATREPRDGKRALQPPPAPERMETQSPGATPSPPPRAKPAPPAGAVDPWTQRQPAPPPDDPGVDVTPDDDDATDSTDPLGAVPPHGRRKLSVNGQGTVMLAMAEHLCKKMVQCGHDDTLMKSMCDTVAHTQTDIPANCPAADRCLRHIDTMSCASQTDDLSQLTSLLTQYRDCADAIRC